MYLTHNTLGLFTSHKYMRAKQVETIRRNLVEMTKKLILKTQQKLQLIWLQSKIFSNMTLKKFLSWMKMTHLYMNLTLSQLVLKQLVLIEDSNLSLLQFKHTWIWTNITIRWRWLFTNTKKHSNKFLVKKSKKRLKTSLIPTLCSKTMIPKTMVRSLLKMYRSNTSLIQIHVKYLSGCLLSLSHRSKSFQVSSKW